MKSDFDKIIRDSFSEKIEVPEEFQQKMKATLKQAHTASAQKEKYAANQCYQPDRHLETFFYRHKISTKAYLSLAVGLCACLGFAAILSVFWKQNHLRNNFNTTQNQYTQISATPTTTENTTASDHILQTEIPADTEFPQKTNMPSDSDNPAPTENNTHISKNMQKNDTEKAQKKNTSKPNKQNTDTHNTGTHNTGTHNTNTPKRNASAKPKKTETPHSTELAQVQTSYTPETIDDPKRTSTPANIESPIKTKTPETQTPPATNTPITSTAPDSEITFPAAMETPSQTPM